MTTEGIERVLDAFRRGGLIVLADDKDESQGGVIMAAAEAVTAEQINFMARRARGLICLTLMPDRCEQLNLPLMVPSPDARESSNFTVSIEAADGVTTGISAADRSHTIRTAVAKNATPRDLVQPGHVFPLRAAVGGVLKRAGYTESGCDLARLAGYEPASVIADVLNDDGSVAINRQLVEFARQHELPIGTIAELIDYRIGHETTVERIRSGPIATQYGDYLLHLFKDRDDKSLHLALTLGDIEADRPCLVRVQLFNTLRDGVGTLMPGDSPGWNLRLSLERITQEGCGVLVLINEPESDEELLRNVERVLGDVSTGEQTGSVINTVGLGSQILRQIGVGKIRLLGPAMRYNAISGFGLEVVEYLQV